LEIDHSLKIENCKLKIYYSIIPKITPLTSVSFLFGEFVEIKLAIAFWGLEKNAREV